MDELASVSFIVSDIQSASRLDVVVTAHLKEISTHLEDDETFRVTRSQVSAWISDGRVRVNKTVIRKSGERVTEGGVIEISIPQLAVGTLQPDDSLPLDIIHEESSYLVLNKGAGQIVHPGAGVTGGTVVHALLARFGDAIAGVGSPARPGIVHRLDKDTTGLMVVAKTKRAYESFIDQFAARTISRRYLGLTIKTPKKPSPIVLPIGRDPRDRTKMAVVKSGKSATTHWSVRESFVGGGFLLDLVLETGRTHQIRVHLLACNAPLVGDRKYPCPEQTIPAPRRASVREFGRQALHAERLRLQDPVSGETKEFFASPPPDLERLIVRFREAG